MPLVLTRNQGMVMTDLVSDKDIRKKAHELWVIDGCPEGLSTQHWLVAEMILSRNHLAALVDSDSMFTDVDVRNPTTRAEILEQYKAHIQATESLVGRRQATNQYFATATILLLSGFFALWSKDITIEVVASAAVVTGIVGVMLCFSWHNQIDSHSRLSTEKLNISRRIEGALQLANIAKQLQSTQSPGQLTFCDSEKYFPMAMFLAFLLVFVVGAFKLLAFITASG
jgi:hypothetical protein